MANSPYMLLRILRPFTRRLLGGVISAQLAMTVLSVRYAQLTAD